LESSLEFWRSWYVEGHIRSGVISSVLMQQHQRTIKQRHKRKKISKPITPLFEPAFKEDSELEQAQRDKDMQKNLALIANYFKKIYKPTNNNLRTSLNSRNNNVDTTRYVNEIHTGQFRNQRTITVVGARETVGSQKPKRIKDYTYHKEKMLLCKQAEKGVPLQVEQADWVEDMDEEIDKKELEVHYNYMVKNQEVPTQTQELILSH
nr:hypothetical protein [Tanacetum cinerariifolium]